MTNSSNLCYYGGVGGAEYLKRKKIKDKKKNPRFWKGPYPPQHPGHHIDPLMGFGRHPKSDKTLEEFIESKNEGKSK